MLEISYEKIDKILHEETLKTEDSRTIQRALYNRNMRLYEKFYADIDALNDETISELKKYHEETKSLFMYYYLDIPQDTCRELKEFNEKYTDKLLGPDWHDVLFDSYKNFKYGHWDDDDSEENLKKEFREKSLDDFYDSMDYVFRHGFGTASKTDENVFGTIASTVLNAKD